MTGKKMDYPCKDCRFVASDFEAAQIHALLSQHGMTSRPHKHRMQLTTVSLGWWFGRKYVFRCQRCGHFFSIPAPRFWGIVK